MKDYPAELFMANKQPRLLEYRLVSDRVSALAFLILAGHWLDHENVHRAEEKWHSVDAMETARRPGFRR